MNSKKFTVICGVLSLALCSVALAIATLPGTRDLIAHGPLWISFLVAATFFGLTSSMTLWCSRSVHRVEASHERAIEEVRVEGVERFDRFVRRLDHEIKNPLTVIDLTLDHLRHRGHGPIKSEAIDHQLDRLRSLVRSLRHVSEVRHQDLDLEVVGVDELLKQVVETLGEQGLTDHKWISVHCQSIPARLPAIQCDPGLLFLGLYNLVSNAVKYTHEGAEVRVSAEVARNPDFITIQIADSGVGIPSADLQSVWEELGRGTNTGNSEGNGLGLPLASLIVAKHGGTILLDSIEGQGTRVHVDIPITTPDGPKPP